MLLCHTRPTAVIDLMKTTFEAYKCSTSICNTNDRTHIPRRCQCSSWVTQSFACAGFGWIGTVTCDTSGSLHSPAERARQKSMCVCLPCAVQNSEQSIGAPVSVVANLWPCNSITSLSSPSTTHWVYYHVTLSALEGVKWPWTHFWHWSMWGLMFMLGMAWKIFLRA